MAKKDSGWRPTAAMDEYKGHAVWEYETGPQEINQGEVDGKPVFSRELKSKLGLLDDDVEPTE
ncbi:MULTISPECIES: hypothetical protein [Haloprofundus]|uniref:hypothetical protein n=1 Tax=Haloprofundus TaxID=1911573 RepID=UPI000E451F92|nr:MULTISPECIES: hypothetical protein [Haloprofundus]QCJ46026.1 hypothetical protein FCF25_02330 [Haloprofundus sp. MHR1]